MQADVDPSVKERLFGAEQSDAMLKQVIKARFLRELRQPTGGEDTDEQSGPSTEPRVVALPSAPVRIGRFVILRKLGQGGMGVVYAAFDEQLDRKVAIKVLRRGLADDERGRARMLREAQALARLSHPNVVAVHDVAQWRDHDYVAMEFIAGRTLDAWLHERTGARPWREVLGVMLQAGRGLAAAHACELVHRDFKPANVMVGDEGRVRVLDFGLARSVHEREESAPLAELEQTLEQSIISQHSQSNTTRAFDRELTATGAVLGTPAYMAPEQHQGRTATTLSDQFSFGIVLYEALFGERPFKGHSRAEYAMRVSEGKIDVPSHSGVPAWLRKAVLRALAVDPADRWPSMDALLAELSRERGRGFKVGALVAGFAALIVAGFVMNPSEPSLCEIGDDALAGVWDEGRRGALQQAFAGELDLRESIEARLDQQADALLAARSDACEDRWVRQEQSDAQLALRNQCLDQRARELRATVDQLTSGAQSREHAVVLLDGLGEVGFCDRVDLLEEGAPAPKDAETAAQISTLRDRIADAHALRLASDVPNAWTVVDAIAPDVERLGYGPLQAELAYLRGRLEQREERFEDARVSLLAAATLAEEFGHVELAPAAWTAALMVGGSQLEDPTTSIEHRMAEVALRKIGAEDDDLRRHQLAYAVAWRWRSSMQPERAISILDGSIARLETSTSLEGRRQLVSCVRERAAALHERGQLDQAAQDYRQADELAHALFGDDALITADIAFDHGALLMERDETRAEGKTLIERAGRVYARKLGSAATTRSAMVELALANHALMSGDLDLALTHANRGLDSLPPGHADRSWALEALAVIQANRGALDAAAAAFEEAIATVGWDGGSELAFLHTQLGGVRLGQNDLDGAEREFAKAERLLEETRPQDHPDWAYLRVGQGEAHLLRGNADQARRSFESASTLSGPADDPKLDVDIAWGLARVARQVGDEAEARQHAEIARQRTSGRPHDALSREIDSFLQ